MESSGVASMFLSSPGCQPPLLFPYPGSQSHMDTHYGHLFLQVPPAMSPGFPPSTSEQAQAERKDRQL